MKSSLFLAGGLAAVLALPAVAGAATFVEIGNAGQLRAGANLVNVANLEAIAGSISTEEDADLFALQLTAGRHSMHGRARRRASSTLSSFCLTRRARA